MFHEFYFDLKGLIPKSGPLKYVADEILIMFSSISRENRRAPRGRIGLSFGRGLRSAAQLAGPVTFTARVSNDLELGRANLHAFLPSVATMLKFLEFFKHFLRLLQNTATSDTY